MQTAKARERLAPQQAAPKSSRKISPAHQDVPLWAQLHVTPDKSLPRAAMIEIVLPTGVRVCVSEGTSRQALIDVFAALEMPRC
jgi:hypothetical protein